MHSVSRLVIAPESSFAETSQHFLCEVPVTERWSSLPDRIDIKKLAEFLHFASLSGKKRRAVLHGADTWNLSVSNRLLKVLEEPHQGLEILVLSETKSILPTVFSRLLKSNELSLFEPKYSTSLTLHSNASLLRDTLYLLASSHVGHDQTKLFQATQHHL